MGFIPPANINEHRSVCIVLYKSAGNFMHRRCCTVTTFQDYPRITCKSKACLAGCGVTNAGSVVASQPGNCGTSARLRCCLLPKVRQRSEEHTSELQSQSNLVCRLLLEK